MRERPPTYLAQGRNQMQIVSIAALLIAEIAGLTMPTVASAMDFSIANPGVIPVVFANGPIVEGDAERLRNALAQVPRDNSGMKTLALNSPGGSVEAAYKMASVMDSVGVSTVVPPSETCASACAAILFIAGKFHIVAEGGRLGLHTCYNGLTKIGDELCNESIASFAVQHGTAYGSVFAFMRHTSPGKVIWFSADMADCWGLSRYPQKEEPPTWNQCVLDLYRKLAAPPKN
jgi:hypothetical protein